MKLLYILPLSLFMLVSCENEDTVAIKSFRKGNYIIKGKVIKDSIFNDTMQYFDLKGSLVSAKVYKDGILNGTAIDYYPNGQPNLQTEYANGKKNGLCIVLDTVGEIMYSNFFYYDLPVGPILYYDNSKPKRYFFVDLNNRDLIHIYYPSWGGIESMVKDLINFSVNEVDVNTGSELSVLLYLPAPPRLSFEYSVVEVSNDDFDHAKLVKDIRDDAPFISFALPKLKNGSNRYSIKLTVTDSILNKKSIIYKDID